MFIGEDLSGLLKDHKINKTQHSDILNKAMEDDDGSLTLCLISLKNNGFKLEKVTVPETTLLHTEL